MRIIQTFWSGAANPLIKSYGWPHAEYNLMSWALSCSLLREHYDNVALYTDQRGYDLLIKELKLPYTEAHIVFDDTTCLPQHWAYAKIRTYSMQTEPFLHIDGDVYITQRFPNAITQAGLVVQNKEICTSYYENMIEKILCTPRIILPQPIAKDLQDGKIMSYNMGIFGGNDLNFIRDYCQEAFRFFEKNDLNTESNALSNIDYNIFVEQILFAMMSNNGRKNIATVSNTPVRDNGYTSNAFCDIECMRNKTFLHIIGGHKRNANICNMLMNAMLLKNVSIYKNILSLFPYKNKRFDASHTSPTRLTTEHFVAEYEDTLNKMRKEWECISNYNILKWHVKGVNSLEKFNKAKEENAEVILSPRLCYYIYEMASFWTEEALLLIRERLNKDKYFYLKGVLLLPCIEENGIREIPLSSIGYKIMRIIKEKNAYMEEIIKECAIAFPENKESQECAKEFITNEINELIRSGCILVNKKVLKSKADII